MGNARDTVTYDLVKDRKVVYRGTTNDPARREAQHQGEGKNFNSMRITSRRMTEEGAKQKEAENLERYRRGHSGKNPRYNKDSDG